METQDFVAIDFETMTPELTSACAIGLVRVHNGVISQKFYSLIKPIPDSRTERNTHVHGLTDEMVADAPHLLRIVPFTKIPHRKSSDCMSQQLHRHQHLQKLYGILWPDRN
mgnify:CR=1 FL=1